MREGDVLVVFDIIGCGALAGNPQGMSRLADAQLRFLKESPADRSRIRTATALALLLDLSGHQTGVALGLAKHRPEQRNDEVHWSIVVIVKNQADRPGGCVVLHENPLCATQAGKNKKRTS
jgi:hypothetical protein